MQPPVKTSFLEAISPNALTKPELLPLRGFSQEFIPALCTIFNRTALAGGHNFGADCREEENLKIAKTKGHEHSRALHQNCHPQADKHGPEVCREELAIIQ